MRAQWALIALCYETNEDQNVNGIYFLAFQSNEKRSLIGKTTRTSQHFLFASQCRASWVPLLRSLFYIRGSEREAIVEDTCRLRQVTKNGFEDGLHYSALSVKEELLVAVRAT